MRVAKHRPSVVRRDQLVQVCVIRGEVTSLTVAPELVLRQLSDQLAQFIEHQKASLPDKGKRTVFGVATIAQ